MNNNCIAKKVSFMGMLFALTIAISFIEYSIVIPFLPPGVKLGLSNIVIMYCLFCLDCKSALIMAVLKSIFVMSIRGVIASVLSITGGIFSIIIMYLLYKLKKLNLSYITISVLGAISHNIGQVIVVRYFLKMHMIYYYIPLLVIAGVVVGVMTGIVFKMTMPYIERLYVK